MIWLDEPRQHMHLRPDGLGEMDCGRVYLDVAMTMNWERPSCTAQGCAAHTTRTLENECFDAGTFFHAPNIRVALHIYDELTGVADVGAGTGAHLRALPAPFRSRFRLID